MSFAQKEKTDMVAEGVMGWRPGEWGVNAGLWFDSDGKEVFWRDGGGEAFNPYQFLAHDHLVLEQIRQN